MSKIRSSSSQLGFLSAALASALLAVACGPSARGNVDDTGDDQSCTPTSQTESCGNSMDDDCDGAIDCNDLDCSGIGGCPVVSNPCELDIDSGDLALPDGVCEDEFNPTPDTCQAYDANFNISGFGSGATLNSASQLIGVCVTMEHSWLRDLEIDLVCPSGQRVPLNMFRGQDGGEVFLGTPNDDDDDSTPVPGTGAEYCWKASATNPSMLDYANAHQAPDSFDTLNMPPGDYKPDGDMNALVGCTLDGTWQLEVIDEWFIDNGFIFSSKMLFADGNGECPVLE